MNVVRSCTRWSVVLWMGAAAASCGKAGVTGPSDDPGAGPGGGRPGSGPSFTLPPAVPTAAAPDAGSAPGVQCAEEAHRAEIVPLDLLFLVDSSGSMTDPAGTRTKWETAQSALGTFIRDPRSADLAVGLHFFPGARPCTADRDCFPGLPGEGRFCLPRTVCVGTGAISPPMGCGPIDPFIGLGNAIRCPMGTRCVAEGACAGGGADCPTVGQACPAGGGACLAKAKSCQIPSFGDAECLPANYEKPLVAIGQLPMAAPPLLRELNGAIPVGGTPMGPAVRGALAHLRARLTANPGRRAVLVLASDGLPQGTCQMNDIPTIAGNIGAAFTASPSIATYVIGVFAPSEVTTSRAQLDQLAVAGGTSRSFVLAATDDLTMRLQEALNQIRGAALACEYQIPAPTGGRIDFAKVNVRYSSAATPENIPYVERADGCDPMRGGWYYDVPPASAVPTRILMCDATCRRFKSDQAGRVDLVFGCGTQIIN